MKQPAVSSSLCVGVGVGVHACVRMHAYKEECE